jgi:hypothetical protein
VGIIILFSEDGKFPALQYKPAGGARSHHSFQQEDTEGIIRYSKTDSLCCAVSIEGAGAGNKRAESGMGVDTHSAC